MIIESERLLLRNWQKQDVKDIVEGLNDFETAKNLTVPFPYKNKDAEDFIAKNMNFSENSYYFAIQLKKSSRVISGLNIKVIGNKAKGGIWINKLYQGKGYGIEAFKIRAKFAFEKLGVEKLENGFFSFNEVSWNMQKSLGYKIKGEKENFSPALNKAVKEIVTCLSKEDYIKKDKFNDCVFNVFE